MEGMTSISNDFDCFENAVTYLNLKSLLINNSLINLIFKLFNLSFRKRNYLLTQNRLLYYRNYVSNFNPLIVAERSERIFRCARSRVLDLRVASDIFGSRWCQISGASLPLITEATNLVAYTSCSYRFRHDNM